MKGDPSVWTWIRRHHAVAFFEADEVCETCYAGKNGTCEAQK